MPEDTALKLAALFIVSRETKGKLLPILENSDTLNMRFRQAHSHFTKAVEKEFVTSYASEWFLDNFYIVQQTVRQITEDMPPGYYKQLPKLSSSSLAGYPRIYALARVFGQSTNSRVTQGEQFNFIKAYLEQGTLTSGELWAWPVMLRVMIIENLLLALDHAQALNAAGLVPVILQNEQIAENDTDAIVANCIMSLRMINIQNWLTFFEDVSPVERILRNDPSGVYEAMDFGTRNTYRHKVEQLAKHSHKTEEEIAEIVLQQAQASASSHADDLDKRTAHVGYYLIDKGIEQIKTSVDYRSTLPDNVGVLAKRHAFLLYIGTIILLTLVIELGAIHYASITNGSVIQILGVFLLIFIPAANIASQFANWATNQIVKPSILPKMDFSEGIPDSYRTIVVIPALVDEIRDIDSLVQQLEQHYLRNTDTHLYFGILADYIDASEEEMPTDAAFAEHAKFHIKKLNDRYKTDGYKPFYFFLRRRQWNPSEGKWMGYERKRGKLMEFNRLLLDPQAETSFSIKFGDLNILNKITYVITVDEDTVLPRDSAQRLVGTLAHPLNKAQFSLNGEKIEAGYTILQPRVEVLPEASNQTSFTRIFAGERGLDLYTLAVSDVYQDLFGEGIYVGKGIYDVAAFERSLKNRIPENALLSHDLFEGLYGRAGLVTDIVLLEDYPANYLTYMNRLHRWIRGDWQLLPWLLPHVPGKEGYASNNFSGLDIWKIVHNLQRSLLQPTLLILVFAGWFLLPGSSFVWTVLAMIFLMTPFLIGLGGQLKSAPLSTFWDASLRERLTMLLTRWGLSLAFLPYDSYIRLDAIITTIIRLRQRKYLLQWTTAANASRMFRQRSAWQQLLGPVIFATGIALIAFLIHPESLIVSVPLIAVWFSSPFIADRISRPQEQKTRLVKDERQLRTLARRTWLYFEEFVGPNDHWLPPDHYQHSPREKTGHYTSPTNIGLMLLSTLAAYDFGYIGLLEFMLRGRFAFDSIGRLEHYRGHLLNWYSTETLQSLPPRYVSTVDSGNFAGSLIVLKQGYEDLLKRPVLREQRWQGVIDILDIITEILEEIAAGRSLPQMKEVNQQLQTMREQVVTAKQKTSQWSSELNKLTNEQWGKLSQALTVFIEASQEMDAALLKDLRIYLERLQAHFSSMRRDMELLLPWLVLLEDAPISSNNGEAEVREIWEELAKEGAITPCFSDLYQVYERIETRLHILLDRYDSDAPNDEARVWCQQLVDAIHSARSAVDDLLSDFQRVEDEIEAQFQAIDFSFLYNNERDLFHIGYNVDTEQLDNSYYDLLASEARLASFLAIAKRDVPLKHWLQLSRPVTLVNNIQTLLSWSGTMFEYLMPLLMMRDYSGTLLHQSYQAVVKHQIRYGKQHEVPWGISESGYYAFDTSQNYQYRAFGVPSLAIKRGQDQDLVIAPYASMMALPIQPDATIQNLHTLKTHGALSTYGLIEAIDYTTTRLPFGLDHGNVKEYMAHHQCMIFITLANFLNHKLMEQRFHCDPRVKSIEFLLMEQIPRELTIEDKTEAGIESNTPVRPLSLNSWDVPINSPLPQAHYLSNGQYAVMITSGGGGYSQWKSRAITRWSSDTTLDHWGTWIYIHDCDSRVTWSPTFQPMGGNIDAMRAAFHPHKAEFINRTYAEVSSRLEILVPPNDNLEIRRLWLTNHTEKTRHLKVSSYGEMVLSPQNNDQRHPAFNKMFIESEYLPELRALLFKRRLRSPHDEPLYVIHMLVQAKSTTDIQYETDRAHFLGRNRTYRNPVIFDDNGGFKSTTGATLDPIMALSQMLEIPAHSTMEIAYVTLASESREEAMSLAKRYHYFSGIEQAFSQSRYSSERELRQLALDSTDIARYQKLLSALLYPHALFRAAPEILSANTKSQSGLWAYGISGDYPIVVVEVKNESELELVGELIQAHRFWRNQGFASTIVILNQRDSGYMQELYNQVHRLLLRLSSETWINRHDGIFIVRAEQMNDPDRILLQTAARVYLKGDEGDLEKQLAARQSGMVTLPMFLPTLDIKEIDDESPLPRPDDLLFDNGLGGFTPDGQEYVIYLTPDTQTPAPWINVVANADAGFTISEAGGGFSWAHNSSENRLSTWRNDPITDMPSEIIYLRDEETAAVWSPTPMPAPTEMPYIVRHGAGYSVIEHQSHGLRQTTQYYMASDVPVKFMRVRLKNTASRARRITITYYVEWVLGPVRDMTHQYLIPEFDADNQTMMIHNPYSLEFSNAYTFVTANRPFHGFTTDRTEFLGRMGSYARPAALSRIGLSNAVSIGRDPCTAIQLHIDLPVGGEEEICFIVGSGKTKELTRQFINDYRTSESVQKAWDDNVQNWRKTLDSIVVRTPNSAMNVLLPWLLYQTLSCRILGRSALYQSGGAFGFRDQLQDVMALIHVRPDIAREHILRAASHQFEAGDVLHWWHPPSARGVRTRFSDDPAWLPFVVSYYVKTTGDTAILRAKEPFLKGESLRPEEEERYGFYESTSETYTLYEHCQRALKQADTSGRHGLPLMKAGDWNDGMNLIGVKGRGESVWMGWFLYATFDAFISICDLMNDIPQAEAYRRRMGQLKDAIETSAWDGEWYRRAYFDDGTPLGSKQSLECQIDSIVQSWSVLSGAARPERAQIAMDAVKERLILEGDKLIMLFTPPFDHTPLQPGYIKGYPPGIRENGGQYTHAALWAVWAFAEMGRGTQAEALFNLMNPIYHSDTFDKAKHYKVEPYVIAADVYSVAPHNGRGGWTWYTGSAGWMYRLAIEAILGLHREGEKLIIEPRISQTWPGYEVDYRYGSTIYTIEVRNPELFQEGVLEVHLDNEPLASNQVSLVDDGKPHKVIVLLGNRR